MIPIIIALSLLILFQQGSKNSDTNLGTGTEVRFRLYARKSLLLHSHSTHLDNCITVTDRLNLGPLGIHKGKRALSGLDKVSEC